MNLSLYQLFGMPGVNPMFGKPDCESTHTPYNEGGTFMNKDNMKVGEKMLRR